MYRKDYSGSCFIFFLNWAWLHYKRFRSKKVYINDFEENTIFIIYNSVQVLWEFKERYNDNKWSFFFCDKINIAVLYKSYSLLKSSTSSKCNYTIKKKKKNSSSYHNFIKAFFQTFFHLFFFLPTHLYPNTKETKCIKIHSFSLHYSYQPHNTYRTYKLTLLGNIIQVLFYLKLLFIFVLNENEDAWVIYGSLLRFSSHSSHKYFFSSLCSV